MIKFECGKCHHKMGAPDRYAGRQVNCTKCKSAVRIPQAVEQVPAGEPGIIKFRCPSCNQKIGLKSEYAGKRVRCAKCGNPLEVPGAPAQAERPEQKEETSLVSAEQEPVSESGDLFGDLGDMDELLLAAPSGPAADLPSAPTAAGYGGDADEFAGYAGEAPGKSSKMVRNILLAAGCVLVVVVAGLIGWYFISRSGGGAAGGELEPFRAFAEDYIRILEAQEIDKAMRLLSPQLQNHVRRDNMEGFAGDIGREKIVALECGLTYFEKGYEADRCVLMYRVSYAGLDRSVMVSVLDSGGELRIDGIGAQTDFGRGVSLGPRSFEAMSTEVITGRARRAGYLIGKYFCGIVIVAIALMLLQIISMWIVFDRAGHPGWAVIIPYYNMWVLAEVGGKPGWWGLAASLSSIIPIAGSFIGLALIVMISVGVAREFGRGVLFGIGLCFLPFVFYPILAFSKD